MCRYILKTGNECKRNVVVDNGYCKVHDRIAKEEKRKKMNEEYKKYYNWDNYNKYIDHFKEWYYNEDEDKGEYKTKVEQDREDKQEIVELSRYDLNEMLKRIEELENKVSSLEYNVEGNSCRCCCRNDIYM